MDSLLIESNTFELSSGMNEGNATHFTSMEVGEEIQGVDSSNPLAFFNNLVVESKSSLLQAVERFHAMYRQGFRVVRSDTQRLALKCKKENCPFHLTFNFKSNLFKPPTKAINHT